ncbi:GntR family transcriptional regulator [Coralliovum pocilloporae]|uniref:GntR family transcriptional regulator n=1 Tax=Coralliovum pocilloporae TaxID=3066369 RepID=UPI003307C06C
MALTDARPKTSQADKPADSAAPPVHQQTYSALRERILFGGFEPGKPVTLRGLADDLDVSLMPVREAVRRLIAERALELHGNRRVSIPTMTGQRFREILLSRGLLEPELALQALPRITDHDIDDLRQIDDHIDISMANGDTEGYMRGNYLFHSRLYAHSQSQVIHGLVDSLWLQFGPFMRLVYGRHGLTDLVDYHKEALQALRLRDAMALRSAIAEDIRQGMHYIGDALSADS